MDTASLLPKVGYCQGMNHIANTIYKITNSVESSTEIMVGLISNFQLAGLFSDSLPEYHLRAFILHKIILE